MIQRPGGRHLGELSNVAFVLVVLAGFADFLRFGRIEGALWTIPVVFACGSVHVVLGLFHDRWFPETSRPAVLAYTLLQSVLVAGMILLNPVKGFFFLVAMPITSYAVLALSWRWSTVIATGLFAVCVAAVWIDFGATNALQSAPPYLLAFVFTVVFSIATRTALVARECAERLSAELATANEQLRRYASDATETATTRERNRLAREIHDGIGHYLTTINVQLEAARAVFATNGPQAMVALENAARLSRAALDDVRGSVGTLRAEVPRPPLPTALDALARDLGLNATVSLAGSARPLAAAVELALYRSAQEGLTNVSKHAAATQTAVTLDFTGSGTVSLKIADDGHGAPASPKQTGYGLRGIRERVELLGGKMTALNAPDGGFVLTVEIPG